MISITSQPDNSYFHWQNLIQFYNLRRLGLLTTHKAVFLTRPNETPSEFIKEFKVLFPNNVFIFEDTREETFYIPTIKIHGVRKYLGLFGDKTDLFLIDSDVIFRESIDFSEFNIKSHVYCSDTKGYIGYQYLKTKGEDIVNDMCDFIGIDKKLIMDNNDNSGGAQLYYKDVDNLHDYFYEVEIKSPQLYKLMTNHPTYNDYKPPIQAWTSEMWCVLWMLWNRGVTTSIENELSFAWATDRKEHWFNNKILHMAGVTKKHNDMFFKGKYINTLPFNDDHTYISNDSITQIYVNEMKAMMRDETFGKLYTSIK